MADEYIRKQDAIRLAEQGQVQGFPWQFQMLVRLPPADVVPVVRCKDCKNWQHGMVGIGCYWDADYPHQENDFCSRGVRREG